MWALASIAALDFKNACASVHKGGSPAIGVKLEYIERCSQHLAALQQQPSSGISFDDISL
jgi:hypothetical protein